MTNELPLRQLIPIKAVVVTLTFTDSARFSFYHQPAVYSFLGHLIDSQLAFDTVFTLDTPESGRILYTQADRYRFTVYFLPGSDSIAERLLQTLALLPASATHTDTRMPLRNNVAVHAMHDLFTGHQIKHFRELTAYDQTAFEQEVDQWRGLRSIQLRWLSPARLLREKTERTSLKSEQRYCRDHDDLKISIFFKRLYDTHADLLRRCGFDTPPRTHTPAATLHAGTTFWVDSEYCSATGKTKPVGGLCGDMQLTELGTLDRMWLQMLVLGQYIGVGQRRGFGLGRYQLKTLAGNVTSPLATRAISLIEGAVSDKNLEQALLAIQGNQRQKQRQQQFASAFALEGAEDEEQPEFNAGRQPEERQTLLTLKKHCLAQTYQPPPLKGQVLQQGNGNMRALAVPPFWDRVMQRAVSQYLTTGLEQIFNPASHGYRRGHSRYNAGHEIQKAWRQGYRWIYEADISDFFDSVQWPQIECRLHALYRDDPVVALLMQWVAAPVQYQGKQVDRYKGLPQGAPISPLLANLALDAFDNEMENEGFKLVRFADDFIILCKNRENAERAGAHLRQALIDVSGQEQQIHPAAAPRKGWLEALAQRPVAPLPAPNAHPPARTTPPVFTGDFGALAPEISPIGDQGATTDVAPNARAPAATLPNALEGVLLIVTGEPARLTTNDGRLRVERNDCIDTEAPWRHLRNVLLIGNHHITTPAMKAALEVGVSLHLADSFGHYQGVIQGGMPTHQGGPLWLRQTEKCQNAEASLAAARQVVTARLRHQRETLRQRDAEKFGEQRNLIRRNLQKLSRVTDLAGLHGLEGSATRTYFAALATLIPTEFGFDGRNRRPPQDPFNALLSLGYTLLYTQVETLLLVDGLYPWIGFYHQPHGTHAALASDLMEPFRHIVERAALNALIQKQLTTEDFYLDDEKGCRLERDALKRYLGMLWARFESPVQDTGNNTLTILGHIHRQNIALIEWLREKTDTFNVWMPR